MPKIVENLWPVGALPRKGKKVKVHTLDIAHLRSESPPKKCSGMARVLRGFQFYLHTHTYVHPQSE